MIQVSQGRLFYYRTGGKIDKDSQARKLEERRELFDEAAGIVKYRRRKALTEKKSGSRKQQQESSARVRDIMYELEITGGSPCKTE